MLITIDSYINHASIGVGQILGHLQLRGVWVEPSLLAEVEDRAKSAEGKIRHPVFKGLREDL
jgi:ATP-dependent DNA ligase